jgi:hypothetical protein
MANLKYNIQRGPESLTIVIYDPIFVEVPDVPVINAEKSLHKRARAEAVYKDANGITTRMDMKNGMLTEILTTDSNGKESDSIDFLTKGLPELATELLKKIPEELYDSLNALIALTN